MMSGASVNRGFTAAVASLDVGTLSLLRFASPFCSACSCCMPDCRRAIERWRGGASPIWSAAPPARCGGSAMRSRRSCHREPRRCCCSSRWAWPGAERAAFTAGRRGGAPWTAASSAVLGSSAMNSLPPRRATMSVCGAALPRQGKWPQPGGNCRRNRWGDGREPWRSRASCVRAPAKRRGRRGRRRPGDLHRL